MATEPKDPETTPPPDAPMEVVAPTDAVVPAARRPGLPARTSPPPPSEHPPLDVARRVVEFAEDKFTVIFDGKKVIEASDDSLKDAGKVGVWTKADSVTLFDDFNYGEK